MHHTSAAAEKQRACEPNSADTRAMGMAALAEATLCLRRVAAIVAVTVAKASLSTSLQQLAAIAHFAKTVRAADYHRNMSFCVDVFLTM